MDKSEDAFRTISEAAEDLDLPQHVLRFWETRFPQIRPLKRGGGRRYYRPDDVELLRAIRHLLYNDGYTIKGVQRMLKERGVRAVLAMPGERAAQPGFAPVRAEAFDAEDDHPDAARLAPDAPDVEMAQGPLHAAASAKVRLASHASAPEPGYAHVRPAAAFGPQQRQALEMLLAELSECRRILAAASI